jgi:PAS domain S-box-containing protein
MRLNQQRDLTIVKTVSYQKLLDRIPYLAWLMTDDGEILAVNQQWCDYIVQIAGVGKAVSMLDEERSWLFGEVLHEDERESFVRAWEQARSLQTVLNLKLQFQSRQGNWEWFEVELDPDCNELGQTIWICTAICLGGEVAIPNRQQSAQFLEALLANASDGIVACDADGHLVLFNLAAQIFHGLPPEPIEPEDWADYYDLYDRDGIKNLTKSEVPLFRALQGEPVVSQEMMIKSKRGGDRSLLANSTAIYSPTGEKLGAVVLMKDITVYKQAETERLRIQLYNERLSIAMRVAKAGAWNWDLVTKQTFWTPEFEVLFDYEPGSTEQVYSEWLDRLHPDDRDRVETILHQAVEGIIPEYRCDYRIVLRNGDIRWIDVVGELHPDEQGKPKSMSGLVYDITDRKQWELTIQTQATDLLRLNNSLILAQQQLQERNQELDRFVSIVAHDLKAPLRAIANLSAWIEEDLQAQIPAENPQLKLLRQRVNRMDALIDGLLRYSRAGRENLATETVDVAEVLAETIDSLSPPSCFQIQIDDNMPILTTKKLLLTQVFANLISNAIKHHNRVDGRVEITVEDLGDRDRFSIADDGPGIPLGESRNRIFEIFQTLNPATDSTKNTGIGLALVKKIVEGEGGEIWLDDESKLGCRFCFTWLKTAILSD